MNRSKPVSKVSSETELCETNFTHLNSMNGLKNYFVNYIDESPVESEIKLSHKLDRFQDNEAHENSKTKLEIRNVVDQIFYDEDLRSEFECIFREFDPNIEVFYNDKDRQIIVAFRNPDLASRVCHYMNGKEFRHKKLEIKHVLGKISTFNYLRLPKQHRVYMQSPPTTPPIAWTCQREDLTSINFDLFLAISKLQMKESFEILAQSDNHPAIIVHPCSDTSDEDDNQNEQRFTYENCSSIDDKHSDRLPNRSFSLSIEQQQQQLRRISGDGDNVL